MREYDLIAIGSGSAMNIVSPYLRMKPGAKVAVIDKDPPGGICLTVGCIPTKLLVHPANLVRAAESLSSFGIDAPIKKVDFARIMKNMRDHIGPDMASIERGLKGSKDLDYYRGIAAFTGPKTLQVGNEQLQGKIILLCIGSRTKVPAISGLEKAGYLTSNSVLELRKRPESIIIIGGGFIAAEYGHFLSAMGTKVTIIGRNPKFLPAEDPIVGEAAKKGLGRYCTILTNHEAVRVEQGFLGPKRVIARNRETGAELEIKAKEILVAVGRESNADLLNLSTAGIELTSDGWIKVDKHLETSAPGVWAFGDAIGVHLFKHTANYESRVVFYNAIHGEKRVVDYHAVPGATFTWPEVASVGMREAEAVKAVGKDSLLIGFYKYADTAKGAAIGDTEGFVKVILHRDRTILGASIVGPEAAILLQSITNLMYTEGRNAQPLIDAQHIHPALAEVVERAFQRLMPFDQWQHQKLHLLGIPHDEHGGGHDGHGH